MIETCLIHSISKYETYPKLFDLSITGNSCYISIITTDWTAQMFYELPAIKINIYYNDCLIKEKFIKTYNPMFPIIDTSEVIVTFNDLPTECTFSITPIFDNNAIEALKQLNIKDIDIKEPTELFNLKIIFTNSER